MQLHEATTRWWDIRTAARHADLSIWHLYRAAAAGELHHVRVGGRRTIRTKREWVDQWLQKYECGQ